MIRQAPRPLAGVVPWDDPATQEDDAYMMAILAIAHAFLILRDERGPAVLDLNSADLYELVQVRWPGFDKWIGGARNLMTSLALHHVRLHVRQA